MKVAIKAHSKDRDMFELWMNGHLVAVIHCDFFYGLSDETYEDIVEGEEEVMFELKEIKK